LTTKITYHMTKRPLDNDVFCGDTGLFREFDDNVFLAVVDALGHGEEAQKVAEGCEAFLEKNYRLDLPEMMRGLHGHIKGSRGAVAGLCRLDLKTGELKYVGIGDTIARTIGSKNTHFISLSGVIGYTIPTPMEQAGNLHMGDVLLLHTDGIRAYSRPEEYPELPDDAPATITTRMIEQFGKEHDDALCMALKYLREGEE
jgi:phosphoserine phosphatase RsbX